MGRLENKVCLITGGNSGIGECTAKLFAREGAKVIITARREGELQRVANEILAEGGDCLWFAGDVTVQEDVDRVVASTIDAYGRIDVLVNNAGIPDKHTRTVWVTDELWESVYAVNITGCMRMCRAVLPHMEKVGCGSIVNVASIGGVYGCAGATYSSAKAALLGLTKNIAQQYFHTHIRCNSVSPGSTLTPLFDPKNFEGADVEMQEITKRRHYHERDTILQPIEQANAILFFASDESSGINGQDLVVDYGNRL